MSTRRPLLLTEEETLALLEMCLMTEAEDDPIRAQALDRLGGLYREFLRAARPDAPPATAGHASRAPAAILRLAQRRVASGYA